MSTPPTLVQELENFLESYVYSIKPPVFNDNKTSATYTLNGTPPDFCILLPALNSILSGDCDGSLVPDCLIPDPDAEPSTTPASFVLTNLKDGLVNQDTLQGYINIPIGSKCYTSDGCDVNMHFLITITDATQTLINNGLSKVLNSQTQTTDGMRGDSAGGNNISSQITFSIFSITISGCNPIDGYLDSVNEIALSTLCPPPSNQSTTNQLPINDGSYVDDDASTSTTPTLPSCYSYLDLPNKLQEIKPLLQDLSFNLKFVSGLPHLYTPGTTTN